MTHSGWMPVKVVIERLCCILDILKWLVSRSVIAYPLNQKLQLIPMHTGIDYCFHFKLFHPVSGYRQVGYRWNLTRKRISGCKM